VERNRWPMDKNQIRDVELSRASSQWTAKLSSPKRREASFVGSGNSDRGIPDILTTCSEGAPGAVGSSRPRCLVRIDGPSS